MSRRARYIGMRFAAVLLSLLVALGGSEIILRLIDPLQPDAYHVWPPGLVRVSTPDPEAIPGVSGRSRFSINSTGIRGDEFEPEQAYHLLAIGGSTTECLYLDQEEAWPQIVQTELRRRTGQPAWVGNVGMSGRSTREHELQVEHLLPRHPEIDAIILLVGVNDLHLRLKQGSAYDPMFTERKKGRRHHLLRAFKQSPEAYEDVSRLHALYRNMKARRDAKVSQDGAGRNYTEWRELRRNASEIIHEPPDLAAALGEYRRHLEKIVNTARAHGVRVIFLTQPSLWRSDLTAEESALLWTGYEGETRSRYYSVDRLADAMQAYNDALERFCDRSDVELIDLASRIPRDTSMFYDDVHFTEKGARRVAEVVSDYLIETGGLKRPRPADQP